MINCFFLVRKQHEHYLYTMTETTAMTVATSLSDLLTLASLRNLDVLSKVGRCFWKHCNFIEPPHIESTAHL
jgi:hypothetical protein